MKVILLGSTGQLGSTLRNRFRDRHEIIGTSRKPAEGHLRFNPFTDDWSMLGSADVLINCIGQIDASGSMSFHEIHVELARLIVRHRKLIGCPRILQISALGASPKHRVEFLRTKGIADDLLLQQRDTVVLRPSIVCTPRTMIVRKMRMLSAIAGFMFGYAVVPKGFLQSRIQPVTADDFASLVERLCDSKLEGVINIVGKDILSFRDIISLLSEARKTKIRPLEVPRAIMDLAIEGFVSRAFPSIINTQQYRLLFDDNIADRSPCEALLERSMQPTREFFRAEFL